MMREINTDYSEVGLYQSVMSGMWERRKGGKE